MNTSDDKVSMFAVFNIHAEARIVGRYKTIVSWFREDPCAVHVRFCTGRRWALSRDLLVEGSTRPAGAGDVRVKPSQDGRDIHLTLGEIHLSIPLTVLGPFLGATYQRCAAECEYQDWDADAELAAWLGQEGAAA